MKQPNDLELLILPYLCGELTPQERQRVENAMAHDAGFARQVEEFRQTLAFMDKAQPPIPEGMLENLEERIYREVVARSLETSRRGFFAGLWRYLPATLPGFGGLHRWRPMAGYASLVAAALVFGVYVGEQQSVPTPFSPVAEVVKPEKAPKSYTAKAALRHEEFFAAQRANELDEARLARYANGDAATALAQYDRIAQENPETSAARVAEEERAELLEVVRPLITGDEPVVFLVKSDSGQR